MHNRKGERPEAPHGSVWIEDAATHLGLTLATLRKWRLLGKDTAEGMHGFKVGRFVAYKVADLDAYLEAQYRAAAAPSPNAAHNARPPEPRRPRKAVAARA